MGDQECAVWKGMPLEFASRTDVLNDVDVQLGAEQLRWLSMYGSLDLAHWRWIALGLRKELRWVYVGSEHMPSAVRAYVQRQRVLDVNEFHYWPNSTCRGGGSYRFVNLPTKA